MEIERRILKSTSILLSAGIVSQLANFMFVVYIARAYSPEIFGEYSFALSLGALAAIFVSLGTNRLLLRKCSQSPGEWRTHAGILFPAQAILAGTVWLIIMVAAKLMGLDGTEFRIVAIVSSLQLLTPIWGLLAIGFTATERMTYSALADVGVRVLIMVVGSTAVWFGASIELVLLVLPISGVLAVLALFRLASTEFGAPNIRFDRSALFDLWREAMPFFGMFALTVAYTRAGVLFLRSTGGAEQVAIFAPAERLVMVAGILHGTFGQAIFPAMVRLIAGDIDRYKQLADRCARLMLLISLPVASTLYLFAEDLIGFLFGDSYRQSVVVLKIMAWLIAFRGITAVLEPIGIASDHRKLILIAKSAALVCLLILCFVLLPAMGAIGLAFSMLAAQVVKLAIVYFGLRPTGYLPSIVRPWLPTLFACAVTIVIARMLADYTFWLRALAVIVFGSSLLWLFRAVRRPDINFLHQLLRGEPEGPNH